MYTYTRKNILPYFKTTVFDGIKGSHEDRSRGNPSARSPLSKLLRTYLQPFVPVILWLVSGDCHPRHVTNGKNDGRKHCTNTYKYISVHFRKYRPIKLEVLLASAILALWFSQRVCIVLVSSVAFFHGLNTLNIWHGSTIGRFSLPIK